MASLIRHALEHAATLERQMAADANRRPDFPTVDLDGIEAARPEALAEMACLCTEALAALYPHSSPKTEWFRVLKEHHCGGPTRLSEVPARLSEVRRRLSEVPAGGTAGGSSALRFVFDEFKGVLRSGLMISPIQMSPARLKSLWKVTLMSLIAL